MFIFAIIHLMCNAALKNEFIPFEQPEGISADRAAENEVSWPHGCFARVH